jgi:hypothetical protein
MVILSLAISSSRNWNKKGYHFHWRVQIRHGAHWLYLWAPVVAQPNDLRMTDDSTANSDRANVIVSARERLAASRLTRDWVGIRRACEDLLTTLDAQAPAEIRNQLHYLIGDAIVASATSSDADLEAAAGHFRTYVGGASNTADVATIGQAYIQLGRVEIRRGKADMPIGLCRRRTRRTRLPSLYPPGCNPTATKRRMQGAHNA